MDMVGSMKCSICMSTRNKAVILDRVLTSIRGQATDIDYEIIVIDDGSTDNTEETCIRHDVDIYRRVPNDLYRNPAYARNIAYKYAKGDLIIAQSDDVIHGSPNVITNLCRRIREGEFLISTTWNYDYDRKRPLNLYTGLRYQRPFFFLGSVWRKDVYAIGGNDEEFVNPAFDDDWFGMCLIRGLKLRCRYVDDIVGYHHNHSRPSNLKELVAPSRVLFQKKMMQAEDGVIKFEASGGPWAYKEGVPFVNP